MPKFTVERQRMGAGPARREPDDALARRPGIAYRLALRLRDPADVAGILAVLSEAAFSLGYLLLLPSSAGEPHAAYVGLGTAEVADLAIRLAARGILVERGEELHPGSPAMRNGIARCVPAAKGATPSSATGATPRSSPNRRKP